MQLLKDKVLLMKVTPTAIPDVLVIEPKVFGDERGFFFESFNQKAFDEAVGQPRRRSCRTTIRARAQGRAARAALPDRSRMRRASWCG